MKWKFFFLLTLLVAACASATKKDWDTGAQKQEATEDEMRQQQEDVFRNQFPGGRF